MLQLKNIAKSFAKEKVLEDINIDIQDHEFLVVVGPSGSGKSTLIRIIAGLEKEDSGEIVFNGKNLESLEPKDRNLAMVFQNYALYPHKTVFQNIAFPLEIIGFDSQEIKSKVESIAEKLNLDPYLKRKPRELSGGQRQRVALARAMAKDPEIFLLDEPLSNLDAKLRVQMRNEIYKIRQGSKVTFIYVTHDQVEALTLGDRIAVMNEGKLQQLGSPEEIYNKPANTFVASFIGTPPTNLLELKNHEHIVGIRPEFFNLESGSEKIEIEIQNIEMLGSEFLIYGELTHDYSISKDKQQLIAKMQNNSGIQSIYQDFTKKTRNNFQIPLYFDPDLLYYFNRLNGENIQ